MSDVDDLDLPESRWVDVQGPVHYREWPDASGGGPTFVLVHGLGGSLLNWAMVAPGLARHGRVVALDLAGFGLTPAHGRLAHVGGNWRLLDGFMEALDAGPAILVGNSMGGMISLIQAAHHPGTVDALILVDAAFPRTNQIRAQFDPRVTALFALYSHRRLGPWFAQSRSRRLGAEGLVRETLRVCAVDPSRIDPALVAAMVEQTRQRQQSEDAMPAFMAAARSIFRAQVSPGRYRALVRRVDRPALVTHGARDRLVPVSVARAACAEHPNWTLEVLDDLGHIPQMEAPDRWLGAVESWLAGRGHEADPDAGPEAEASA